MKGEETIKNSEMLAILVSSHLGLLCWRRTHCYFEHPALFRGLSELKLDEEYVSCCV